jgi:hypothetical protein
MSAPDLDAVKAYIGGEITRTDGEISGALAAEKAAQSARCVVPADDAEWPADLAEALLRRVFRNLVVRRIPLGYKADLSEAAVATTRIGTDGEIVRLEAPYRKLVVG